MKIKFLNTIIYLFSLFFSAFVVAQKNQEKIKTEEVTVVKSYTPTLSDASKVKETPDLEEEVSNTKEAVKYTVFSFPVASTFTPIKGSAESVEKEDFGHYYKSYATLGLGNYGTLNAELFANQDLKNNDYVGAMFRHLSSQGGIDGVALNNSFYDTSVDFTYGKESKEISWNVNLGYQNQIYNWYGLPSDFGNSFSSAVRDNLINSIDPKQSFNTLSLDSKIDFNQGFIEATSLKLVHFSDGYGSSENRFYIKPSFKFEAFGENIKLNAIVDYLAGKFDANTTATYFTTPEYGFTNFGISPSYALASEDWTIHLGVGLYYSLDSKNQNNQFKLYPQISASHKIVGDLMVFYAGAEGSLDQNSYLNFVEENPFLAPKQQIAPTDKQFDISAGLKGKLAENVSYNVRASYRNEENKALFKSNDYSENVNNASYAFGNTMHLVYDNLKTLRFFGELKTDFSDNISLGINGTLSAYSTKIQTEAWNLPALKLNAFLDYNITSQWYAGAKLFFVGSRKDLQKNNDLVYVIEPTFVPVTLKSYVDLNAHVGYKHSDRLTFFLKSNNILNQSYRKWMNYPVQGFQIVLGANYKFDF